MAKKYPVFDYAVCMACGVCEQACPLNCIALVKADIDAYKKAYPDLLSNTKCTGCAICQQVCPIDAVQMVERQP